MKAVIIAVAIAFLGYYGYRHWLPDHGVVNQQVARANALSLIRMVETLQYVYWSDRDKLATSLEELDAYLNNGDPNLKALLAARKLGQGYKGFMFSDLVRIELTGQNNNVVEYCLVATPEGQAPGKGYALFIDMNKLQFDENGRSIGSAGALYTFATPLAVDLKLWPSAATLAQWELIERLSPQQGLAEAKALAGAAGKPGLR